MSKIRQEMEERRHGTTVFTREEMDLIAAGFKSQLQELRDAIRNIDIVMQKSKFESKKVTLEQYKQGIKHDLITKGQK